MVATSFTALRRLAGSAFALILVCLCLPGAAIGQAPAVTASAPVGLTHPTGWGSIQQTAIDTNGNWLVVDFANAAAYEFPVNGGAAITLVAPGGLAGTYANPIALLDPSNNLYIGGDFNNCMLMIPYGSAANPWPGLSQMTPATPSDSYCYSNNGVAGKNPGVFPDFAEGFDYLSYSPYYMQPWGITLYNGPELPSTVTSCAYQNWVPYNCTTAETTVPVAYYLVYDIQNSGNPIVSLPVTTDNAINSSAVNGEPIAVPFITTEIVQALKKRAISMAADPWGNVYFVEDSGGNPGVIEIPEATMAAAYLAGAANGAIANETGLARVDPNLPAVTGVVADSAGNLYISDSQQGVVLVPNNAGTPEPSSAVWLTPVPATAEVAIDPVRKIVYAPTNQKQNNGQADVAKVGMDYAELGSSSIGVPTATSFPVDFAFNSAETPDRAIAMENGQQSNDFTVTDNNCNFPTAFAANTSCSVNVTMTPHAVGRVSAELLLQRSDPVGSSAPDYNDAITSFTVASVGAAKNTTITFTANNTLAPGEEIVITASQSDCLSPLNGLELNVLAPSKSQFTIVDNAYQVPASCAANTNGSYSTSATLTAKVYTTIASIPLNGTGLGAIGQAFPGLQSTIGSTLQTPSQVTVDGLGNVYVADPGLHKVLMYPAGSSTPVSVGSNLTSPTGVAVDGAGDIFIADSGAGAVYEIPVALPGLDNSSQENQTSLATGLGNSGLSLAVDGLGDLYVADPSNVHVVKLSGINASSSGPFAQSTTYLANGSTPFQPIAVAVDSNNNLYVIDSSSENLYEFTGGFGTPTAVLSGLSGDTGVAVDPSGAVYLASTGGTTRFPIVNGSVGIPTALVATASSSVALDNLGNVYITPSNGPGVTLISTNATLSLAEPSALTGAGSSTSATSTITNAGNAQLSITGYDDYSFDLDSVTITDFTGADGSPACVAGSPIGAGNSCQVVVTFAPVAGQQGQLTGWVQATSNAINAPITINAAATGLALSNSQTQVTVGANPQVINTPLTVTVTPASGTGTPSGTVQVTYTSWTVVETCTPVGNCTPVPTINPVTVTQISTLTEGQAQFTLAPVLAGSETFTVGYTGDRTFGSSTGTAKANVAKSAIAGFTGDTNPPPYLPFVQESSAVTPYDGSNQYWTYSMPVTVNTAIGVPTGTISYMDNSTACPPGTTLSGVGAATCALANYSGISCPASNGAGVVAVVNTGTPSATSGGSTNFVTSCLQMPQFTTYTPVISTHYITPVFSGDANFTGATDQVSTLLQVITGPLVNITTTPPAAPSAPISVPSLSVAPGSTANLSLYLAPLLGYGFQGKGGTLNNYNYPVTLSCDNLPPHTACTFTYPSAVSPYQPSAPNSAQICPQPSLDSNTDTAAAFEALAEDGGCNAGGVGVVTLTINTNVTVGTTTTSQNASAASVTLASLFGLGMIGLFVRRRAFEKARRFTMFVLMVVGGALAVTLSACNTTNLSGLAQVTTPAGTYAVNITASQVGTQCVPATSGTINCTTSSGGTGKLVTGSNNNVSLPYYINLTVQ